MTEVVEFDELAMMEALPSLRVKANKDLRPEPRTCSGLLIILLIATMLTEVHLEGDVPYHVRRPVDHRYKSK